MPFPITCTACGKIFSIADDVYERKVKGRVVTIKCKQCGAGIRIDDAHGGSHDDDDAEPLSVAQPEPIPTRAAAPAPAPPAAAPAAAAKEEPKPVATTKLDTPKAETPEAQP